MSNDVPNIWGNPKNKNKNSHLYVESITGIIDLISL